MRVPKGRSGLRDDGIGSGGFRHLDRFWAFRPPANYERTLKPLADSAFSQLFTRVGGSAARSLCFRYVRYFTISRRRRGVTHRPSQLTGAWCPDRARRRRCAETSSVRALLPHLPHGHQWSSPDRGRLHPQEAATFRSRFRLRPLRRRNTALSPAVRSTSAADRTHRTGRLDKTRIIYSVARRLGPHRGSPGGLQRVVVGTTSQQSPHVCLLL